MSDIYCAEQINIPPTFPHILKQYAKAAIRTQPYDLLQWTCAYFRALANCDVPPVKERLEYPPFCHPSGITPGYLRTLLNVFGHVGRVCVKSLLERWQGVALPETTFFRILLAGRFLLGKKQCRFYEFLAIACGFLGKNLFETMIYVCELLTEEPEGGSAMIPLRTFVRLYEYLAKLDCSGECTCAIMEEDTKELSVSVSEQPSSTSESRLYVAPSESLQEDEDTAGLVDVCGFTPSESRSSRTVEFSKDYVIERRRSEVEEIPRPSAVSSPREEIQAGSMDRQAEQRHEPETGEEKAEEEVAAAAMLRATIPDFHFLDRGYSMSDRDDDDDDSYGSYGEEEEAYEEKPMYEETDDYQPIGLESILHGICECLEPVRESDHVPEPPPPDPFQEFLERMKREVEEGRLETRFRVEGIGGPVPTNRITAVALWLADCGRRQDGLVGPRNIRHFLCPDLEDRCKDKN